MKREELSGLLKALAVLLEDLDEREFNDLVTGQGRLAVESKKKATSKDDNLVKFKNLIQKLKQAESREEAVEILDQETKLKADLVEVAKFLPVNVAKGDNKGAIREKIVECLVGPKLKGTGGTGLKV